MTFAIIGPEAGERLTWAGITAAIEAGHRLPRASIADILLYRGKDTLLDRAAWIDGLGTLVKVATIYPGNLARGIANLNGTVTLFDDPTGRLRAILDFHLVTRWKTAGDSLLMAGRLARPDSRRILLVGAGTVAGSMREAYASVFPQATFTVWGRDPSRVNLPGAETVTDLATAVAVADIICTATMSSEPLIRGDWLRPGQHLDLIGAYTPAMREVDDTAMSRARVFVDSRATTVHHIGEIMAPIASGALTEAGIVADLYDPPALWRRSPDDITIAKNGGGAHLDLMTADWIVRSVAAT